MIKTSFLWIKTYLQWFKAHVRNEEKYLAEKLAKEATGSPDIKASYNQIPLTM
jgi:hypothetical protein